MKKGVFLTLFLCVSGFLHSQTVWERWMVMPDSLVPFFDTSKRSIYVPDTLTADYLRLSPNGSTVWQMKLLPASGQQAEGESVIAVSMSVSADYPESKVTLYTYDWKLLSDTIYTGRALLERPETMAESEFNDLLDRISLVLWKADFSPQHNDLILSPSFLFVPRDEKERFSVLKMQKILKWNGVSFK